jgi:hypothetical protein
MKTFNASDLAHKRTEIFNAAKSEGAILQRKNTNGVVLDEFLLIANKPLVNSGHSIQMVRDSTKVTKA